MPVNEPATIWQSMDGLSEFSSTNLINITDTTGANLTDPSGVIVTDTGVVNTRIPSTIWTEDDSQ